MELKKFLLRIGTCTMATGHKTFSGMIPLSFIFQPTNIRSIPEPALRMKQEQEIF
jgi:hypothetical protein